jgi:esterase/lipase superfamily enzyme
MLAAPDVDVDVARTEAESMGPNHPKFTLFVSRDDRALAVSRRVWGGSRLGAIDPTKEPYRSALEQYGVHPVDLTDIKSDDSLNHGKFAQSGVVTAIGRQLSGQAIETRAPSLGEGIATIIDGATNTINSAANIAVSAPIAIVDPQTRENVSERLGALVGADDQVEALAVSDVPNVRHPAAPQR